MQLWEKLSVHPPVPLLPAPNRGCGAARPDPAFYSPRGSGAPGVAGPGGGERRELPVRRQRRGRRRHKGARQPPAEGPGEGGGGGERTRSPPVPSPRRREPRPRRPPSAPRPPPVPTREGPVVRCGGAGGGGPAFLHGAVISLPPFSLPLSLPPSFLPSSRGAGGGSWAGAGPARGILPAASRTSSGKVSLGARPAPLSPAAAHPRTRGFPFRSPTEWVSGGFSAALLRSHPKTLLWVWLAVRDGEYTVPLSSGEPQRQYPIGRGTQLPTGAHSMSPSLHLHAPNAWKRQFWLICSNLCVPL